MIYFQNYVKYIQCNSVLKVMVLRLFGSLVIQQHSWIDELIHISPTYLLLGLRHLVLSLVAFEFRERWIGWVIHMSPTYLVLGLRHPVVFLAAFEFWKQWYFWVIMEMEKREITNKCHKGQLFMNFQPIVSRGRTLTLSRN